MFEYVPEKWQLCALSDIATIYNGNSINKTVKQQKYTGLSEGRYFIATKDVEFDGSVIYENGVKIPFSETSFKTAPAGSVFVCSEGGSAGKKTAYITQEVCFGNKLYAIVNTYEKFIGKYLFYYTRYNQFFDQFKGLLSGIIGGVSSKHFGEICIPLPPLPEQERIVSRIEELFSQLDAGVETLKKTKAQLAVYRQAVYSECYANLPISAKITDYFDITGGLTKHSNRDEYPIKKPYLRVANVYYNQLDLKEIKEIGVREGEIAEKTLSKDDLLFVEGNGSKDQIGRVAIWDGSIEGCLHQNHIIKGRPNGKILSKFALYYLISTFGRKQIVDVASSTSGLYTLSTGKIGNLYIPFCEIAEQNAIIENIESRLSVCDSIEQTVDTALQQAEAMRQSILKDAFEGRL